MVGGCSWLTDRLCSDLLLLLAITSLRVIAFEVSRSEGSARRYERRAGEKCRQCRCCCAGAADNSAARARAPCRHASCSARCCQRNHAAARPLHAQPCGAPRLCLYAQQRRHVAVFARSSRAACKPRRHCSPCRAQRAMPERHAAMLPPPFRAGDDHCVERKCAYSKGTSKRQTKRAQPRCGRRTAWQTVGSIASGKINQCARVRKRSACTVNPRVYASAAVAQRGM